MRAINANTIDQDISLATGVSYFLLNDLECPRDCIVSKPISDEHFTPKSGLVALKFRRILAFVQSELDPEPATLETLGKEFQAFLKRHSLNVPVILLVPGNSDRVRAFVLSSNGTWNAKRLEDIPTFRKLSSWWYRLGRRLRSSMTVRLAILIGRWIGNHLAATIATIIGGLILAGLVRD